MKHNLTLLSVLGLNFGFTFAQDVQMLTAVGFPACAVRQLFPIFSTLIQLTPSTGPVYPSRQQSSQ